MSSILRKESPSVGEVHIDTSLRGKLKRKLKAEEDALQKKHNPEMQFEIHGEVCKINNEQRLMYGWASVVEENGETVVDLQGDVITPEELVKAAHDFVTEARVAKMMHEGSQIGEVVESMVFTKDIQDALGIDLKKVGWFIGMKINCDETWKLAKSGKLAAFSIGGSGVREEIQA